MTAVEGDGGAAADIHDRYADRLFDFCLGLLGDRDAAAECVRETFSVALCGLRTTGNLRASLYLIARRRAMCLLRQRHRDEATHAPPTMSVDDQSELARLLRELAGGLSDSDREVLELSYRHGLQGPELSQVLGITPAAANARVLQLRRTVRGCLGALLLTHAARADANACPDLAALLDGWDGQFTVLLRKLISRHAESCQRCGQVLRQRIDPAALLGGAPTFIAAPAWLRDTTLDRAQPAAQPPGPTIVRSKKVPKKVCDAGPSVAPTNESSPSGAATQPRSTS